MLLYDDNHYESAEGEQAVCVAPPTDGRKTLRDYQTDIIAATNREFAIGTQSVLVVLFTGGGKTVVFARQASEWREGNVLIVAHRIELIDQAADKLQSELGYRPPIEQGERGLDCDDVQVGGNVIVGSVQTLTPKRMEKYRNHSFGLVIFDECFPAGTLVDGRPIEDITEGDIVTSFDVVSGDDVRRRVVRTFKNPAPSIMVRVSAGGRSVVATPNHPFFTSRGWVNAGRIEVGDCVYGMWQGVRGATRSAEGQVQQRRQEDVVQPAVLRGVGVEADSGNLRMVPDCDRGVGGLAAVQGQEGRTGLLFTPMHATSNERFVFANNGEHQPDSLLREDEEEQPNGQRRCSPEGFGHYAGDGPQAGCSGRQWSRTDWAGNCLGETDGVVAVYPANQVRSWERLPDALQTRLSRSSDEAVYRDRWWQSQQPQSQGGGRTQDGVLEIARVDSVEVLECGSAGEPSELCPDGFVYNLEVEGEHTYLANGFAVHNCHHAISASWQRIKKTCLEFNPACKFLGVTATPNRTDKAALGIVFDATAYTMNIMDGIDRGWLVPVRQESIYIPEDACDFSEVLMTRNKFGEVDFAQASLEAILTEEGPLHAMAKPILDRCVGQSLVYTAGVTHAHLLAKVLNRYRPGCAAAVDGKTETRQRNEINNWFHEGSIQFLLNFGTHTEGYDSPTCANIVMGRPTKSISLFTQMLGRGTRPLPGVVDGLPDALARKKAISESAKPYMVLMDFCGNTRHRPASCVDALGGDYDVEVRELAAEMAKTTPKADVKDLLEKARVAKIMGDLRAFDEAMAAAEKKKEDARKRIVAKNVRYEVRQLQSWDEVGDVGNEVKTNRGGSTEKQVALLVGLGVKYETAAGYGKRQAGAVIDKLSSERCTVKQANILRQYGHEPSGVNMEAASKIIDGIKARGWK